LNANRTLTVGQGSGISVSATAVAVDSTVIRTTGNQVMTGVKRFFNNDALIIGNNAVPVLPGGTSRSQWLLRTTGGQRGDFEFYTGNATVPQWTRRVRILDTGVIEANGFGNLSDYRTKENISELGNSSSIIKNINCYKFNFKNDPNKLINFGVLAHELQEVVPELVSGTKDAVREIGNIVEYDGTILARNVPKPDSLVWEETLVDENGISTKIERTRTWKKTGEEPVYQSVNLDSMVALILQGLKEATDKIESLQSEVDSLKEQLKILNNKKGDSEP
jgi:hypothetical protein